MQDSNLQQQLLAANAAANTAQLQLNQLRVIYNTKENELSAVRTELAAANNTLNNGATQFGVGQQQYTDLQTHYSTLQSTCSDLNQQLIDTRLKLETAEANIAALQPQSTGSKRQRIAELAPDLANRIANSRTAGGEQNIQQAAWKSIFDLLGMDSPPADKNAAAHMLLTRLLD
jgi:predicted  nucleic acid-binding Zn-ribbon protein